MKKYRVMVEYKDTTTPGDNWKRSDRDIYIHARNRASAENKAANLWTCYTHYTVIEEVEKKPWD